jgi:hypothetical protein
MPHLYPNKEITGLLRTLDGRLEESGMEVLPLVDELVRRCWWSGFLPWEKAELYRSRNLTSYKERKRESDRPMVLIVYGAQFHASLP